MLTIHSIELNRLSYYRSLLNFKYLRRLLVQFYGGFVQIFKFDWILIRIFGKNLRITINGLRQIHNRCFRIIPIMSTIIDLRQIHNRCLRIIPIMGQDIFRNYFNDRCPLSSNKIRRLRIIIIHRWRRLCLSSPQQFKAHHDECHDNNWKQHNSNNETLFPLCKACRLSILW